jgi:hypothetical protein
MCVVGELVLVVIKKTVLLATDGHPVVLLFRCQR